MVAISGAGWVLAPCLVRCVDECDDVFPNRDHTSDGSIGDLSHQAHVSDHNPDGGFVCAIDLDEDLSPTIRSLMPFAEHLRSGRDPRVKYVIYEGRIFKSYVDSAGHAAWEWYPYVGLNDHSHHLHLSCENTAACRNDLQPWGFAVAYAPPKPVPPPAPPPRAQEGQVTYYYVKPTGRHYCVRPWSPAVVSLTPAQGLELVGGGAEFITVENLATWSVITAGAPK